MLKGQYLERCKWRKSNSLTAANRSYFGRKQHQKYHTISWTAKSIWTIKLHHTNHNVWGWVLDTLPVRRTTFGCVEGGSTAKDLWPNTEQWQLEKQIHLLLIPYVPKFLQQISRLGPSYKKKNKKKLNINTCPECFSELKNYTQQ